MGIDIEHLRQWIGRSEETFDNPSAYSVAGLSATLDRDDSAPQTGDATPPGIQWLHFLNTTRQSGLGPDGHTKRGGFLPPVDLPRRMWAGGRLAFHKSVLIGDPLKKVSTICDVTHKSGKSGELVFVLVEHQFYRGTELMISEEHDIVYREEPDPTAPPPPTKTPPTGAVWNRVITPDPVMLFRYSALTFNGHRIHYDYKYVTEVEGYPGLIVHGPLIATLLMDLCRREKPESRLRKFNFRALSPVFDTGPFQISGIPDNKTNTAHVWATTTSGALAMSAEAEFA